MKNEGIEKLAHEILAPMIHWIEKISAALSVHANEVLEDSIHMLAERPKAQEAPASSVDFSRAMDASSTGATSPGSAVSRLAALAASWHACWT